MVFEAVVENFVKVSVFLFRHRFTCLDLSNSSMTLSEWQVFEAYDCQGNRQVCKVHGRRENASRCLEDSALSPTTFQLKGYY